ncbi:MAG: DegT/DnrJ/EryC1/StrS family aminotransferase [Acidobacteriota bacterium]
MRTRPDRLALLGGTPVRERPFAAWPEFDDREEAAVAEALSRGEWGGYPMPNHFASRFEQRFAARHDCEHGQLVANGTVSLEIALEALGVEHGAEVIVPAYTFEATAASALFAGCVPVFADVRSEDYCLCPDAVEAAITSRTQAIVPVHLAMSVADLDRLGEIAQRHGLAVIEDCAHAHGARWRGRGVGSWGDAGSFSFQTSKLMTCGEGGIVVTKDRRTSEKLHALTNCGRAAAEAEPPGLIGHNYRLSDLQAALLDAQLERLDEQLERRARHAERFRAGLERIPGLEPVATDERVTTQAIYQFVLRYDAEAFAGASRDTFVAALIAEGVPCDGRFYEDLTQSPLLAKGNGRYPAFDASPPPAPCPNAARAAYDEAVWLPHPLFLGTVDDVDDVLVALEKLSRRAPQLSETQVHAKARTER